MNFNKKGFIVGSKYIISFFLFATLFVFVAGMYDMLIEEVYYPLNSVLNESLSDIIDNYTDTVHFTNLNTNRANIKDNVIPFNLLFIFLFLYSIIISFQSVIKEKKQDPSRLVFGTIGGMIFLLFVVQKFLFVIIDWFNIEILSYVFTDLIITYIPFYMTVIELAGIIILVWGSGLIIANSILGRDA